MKLIIFLLMFTPSFGLVAAEDFQVTETFDSNKIEEVRIQVESGDIRILGGSEEKSQIDLGIIGGKGSCDHRIRMERDTLHIEVEKKSFLGNCRVMLSAKLPRRVDLNLFTGAGRVLVRGVEGDMDVSTGSGDIRVHDSVIKEFSAKTGSGDISVDRVLEEVEVLCGSGELEFFFHPLAKKGEIEVKTGSGNLKLHLPKESSTSLTYKSFAGKLINDFPTLPDGSFDVSFVSGSGNLSITKLKK